eukprot:gnl/TRDRNA2_/TRDRNA2_123510_c5_seq1.p1 gnl/TRDRNA2_/TRDRNA2_123510_c5~~gnl/TRDRNA2_/TRDRNA2_123510_c5_seq1.p1  ORF type:complete len:215 (+),score=12.18 gnl/TRDRNA2_/TRDRNA2_123510_c5_seq1:150-794(+)
MTGLGVQRASSARALRPQELCLQATNVPSSSSSHRLVPVITTAGFPPQQQWPSIPSSPPVPPAAVSLHRMRSTSPETFAAAPLSPPLRSARAISPPSRRVSLSPRRQMMSSMSQLPSEERPGNTILRSATVRTLLTTTGERLGGLPVAGPSSSVVDVPGQASWSTSLSRLPPQQECLRRSATMGSYLHGFVRTVPANGGGRVAPTASWAYQRPS